MFECVSTFTVPLPRTTAETPRRRAKRSQSNRISSRRQHQRSPDKCAHARHGAKQKVISNTDWLLSRASEGESATALAKKLGVYADLMREFFREHGLPLGPNSGLDLPEPKIIMEYQRKGSSSRKLAQQYNCSDVLDADEVLAAHHAGEDDVPMSPPPAPNFTPRQG